MKEILIVTAQQGKFVTKEWSGTEGKGPNARRG